MNKIGFDNEKYLKIQSKHIKERIDSFGGKLYLEFGGKLFDDYHASRVLPGFAPDSKIRMLKELKDQTEIVIAIKAGDIEKNKVRGDLGITYDEDVLRLIDAFTSNGLMVGSVVLTQFKDQPSAIAYEKKLKSLGLQVYRHYMIPGYPSNMQLILSDDGYGKNDYIKTTRPLVVVTAPGPGSGKMATCLSQLYQEAKRGVKAGYAKFETFPIWNIPLNHSVNLAYEAATADLRDVNMLDSFHLEAYGEMAVNYNRDLEVFPVVKRIIEKITGETEYQSPTDMGVNRIGLCITDDEVVKEAAVQEIIRRFMIAKCDYKKGKITEDALERSELLMKEVGAAEEDRAVVIPAREYAEYKRNCDKKYVNVVVMAIEMPDGTIVTGRSSRRMVAAGAAVLNAVKKLAGIPDDLYLIAPNVFKSIQELKGGILHHDRTSLNVEEILTALSISAESNSCADKAVKILEQLNGCKAHCTAILSERDEQTLRAMGIDVTCDPEYLTTNLYFA